MARINITESLPFPLGKPNADTPVTEASNIGYGQDSDVDKELTDFQPLKDIVTDGENNLFDKTTEVLNVHPYLNAQNEFTDNSAGQYYYYLPLVSNIDKGGIYSFKLFTEEQTPDDLDANKLLMICANSVAVGGTCTSASDTTASSPIRGYLPAAKTTNDNLYLCIKFKAPSIVQSDNLFDKNTTTEALSTHLYLNSSNEFTSHANGRYFYYIPLVEGIDKGDIYSYKLFTTEGTDSELGAYRISLICADSITVGGTCTINGTTRAQNPIRGYMPTDKTINNNLYLVVQFSSSTFDETAAEATIAKIIDKLMVIKATQAGQYPDTYEEGGGTPQPIDYNANIQKIKNALCVIKATYNGQYPESLSGEKKVEVQEQNLSKALRQKINAPTSDVADVRSRKSGDQVTINLVDENGDIVGTGTVFSVGSGGSSGEVVATQLNVIESITYKVDTSPISDSDVTLGTGWSGTIANGFVHTSGNTDTLEIDVTSYFANNAKVLITFDATGISSETTDVLVSSGDGVGIKSYNGGSKFEAGVIYDGGTIKFTPKSSYAGTITNLKIRAIDAEGSETYTRKVDNVYNTEKSLVFGFWNVFIGGTKTASSMQDGTRNIAIGMNALDEMTVGNRNVAVGTYSMAFLTEGENNVSVGSDTLYPVTKAFDSVAIGKATMSGSEVTECIAIGHKAMGSWNSTWTRTRCTVMGVSAAGSILTNGTFIGYRSGANVSGANNTAIGYNSMAVGSRSTVDVTGTELTCVGYNCEIDNTATAKAATNSTAIGANTKITKSNQVVIGNSSVTEVKIAGKIITFNQDGTVTWQSE